MLSPAEIDARLLRLLPRVEKPARYVGGELNQVVKPWEQIPLRVALAFPDVYEIGMPNLGLAALYELVNQQPEMLAERVYVPWTDMQALMRAHDLPLFSLETRHALRDFDLVGISLPYESIYTNVLTLLALGGIPLLASARVDGDPLVLAGGHATFNPEPMADFIDAFVIGDGEEALIEVAHTVLTAKRAGATRATLLRALAALDGIYVPALYDVSYHADGRVAAVSPRAAGIPAQVCKRVVATLPPPLTRPLVPNLDTVHNRVAVEIMRGCTRGCRFCHAGMVTRPVRERTVEEIVGAIDAALGATGFGEVGLLSLSSSDYSHALELVRAVAARFGSRGVNISLPSLRIESFSVELMQALAGNSRRGGFTLAPEAASERMRAIINKPVSTAQLLETAREIYSRGWHTIKLYFMIGHPEETLADVEAIAALCQAVLAEGRQVLGARAKLHAGISTFVPKPHTPFQWVACDSIEQIAAKQQLLRQRLRQRAIKLSWSDPRETMLEAWLARGDRRLGAVILAAWQAGASFDAWREHFRFELWEQAFDGAGLDPAFYTHRPRALEERLPWEHIDAGVSQRFLREDRAWSAEGRLRDDCRERCFACGVLPTFKALRAAHPGPGWKCPEVGPPATATTKNAATAPAAAAAMTAAEPRA
ncbi:MAG: TIGR03960 family B12-binding radical SAM protein [Proteobacteria bacterium]|nr:TIGR03960 family B12-binding radical SAM protein [Pseudomonadota bacterium]